MKFVACAIVGFGALSCVGTIGETGHPGASGGEGGAGPGEIGDAPILAARSGVRRLTRNELGATIKDLLLVDAADLVALLPEDSIPFDNDYARQFPSEVLVNAVKTVAEQTAARVMADPAKRPQVIGCTTKDMACLGRFVSRLGQRALRRPLDGQEAAALQAFAAQQEDFDAGVTAVIRVLLQDLEFLYRIERGTPARDAGDLLRLNGWEVASRLSFLLWGSMPTDDLFALAAAGQLDTAEQVAAAARKMLSGALGGAKATKRARDRVDRFHAMWLRYDSTLRAQDPIGSRLRTETNALLERVIFEKQGSWLDLFRSTETYIDDTLAAHYGGGMPKPGSGGPKWTSYGGSGRQGILSHGSYLSAGNAPADTSTTRRGKHVRNELLCEEIPPPMAGMMLNGKPVDTTKPPTPKAGECRLDRIRADYLGNGCSSCHNRMDKIGLGLEAYDVQGRSRTHEEGLPNCPVSTDGELVVDEGGMSTAKIFHGPAGLANLLVTDEEPRLSRCLVSQFLRFAGGRVLGQDEDSLVDETTKAFRKTGYQFQELLLAHVSSPSFGYRLAE